MQCDPEASEDRPLLEPPGGDRLAGTEQPLGVEVDGAGVDLDVTGVRQPGTDQRPYRVQTLQHHRPVIRQVLIDGIEATALRGGAVQLLYEDRRPSRRPADRGHEVTARGYPCRFGSPLDAETRSRP